MNSNDGLVPSPCQTQQSQLLCFQTGSTRQHSPKAVPPPLMEGIQIHIIPISPMWPAAGVWSKISSCWLQPYQGFHCTFAGACCMGCSPAVSGGKAACCIALSSRGRGLLDERRDVASCCLCCATLHLHVFQVDAGAEIIQTRYLILCHSFSVAQAPWLRDGPPDGCVRWHTSSCCEHIWLCQSAATQPGWAGSSERGTKTRLMPAPILHSQGLWDWTSQVATLTSQPFLKTSWGSSPPDSHK